MTGTLLWAVIVITLALVFYTIAVWSGKVAGRLKSWHVTLFWMGLACDLVGTILMAVLAGGLSYGVHTASGIVAILLMLGQAIWATQIMRRGDEAARRDFPNRAIGVWVIWMIAFVSGAMVGMAK